MQPENTNIDVDIHKEYARQREHLEKSIASLRKKLAKDSEIHRTENVRIIQVRFLNFLYEYFYIKFLGCDHDD